MPVHLTILNHYFYFLNAKVGLGFCMHLSFVFFMFFYNTVISFYQHNAGSQFVLRCIFEQSDFFYEDGFSKLLMSIYGHQQV